jgi:hypothetical protein
VPFEEHSKALEARFQWLSRFDPIQNTIGKAPQAKVQQSNSANLCQAFFPVMFIKIAVEAALVLHGITERESSYRLLSEVGDFSVGAERNGPARLPTAKTKVRLIEVPEKRFVESA